MKLARTDALARDFRPIVTWVAVASIVTAGFLKFATGGWGVLVFGIGYLGAGVIHFAVHRWAGSRLNPTSWALALCIVSDFFLILASLLQLDQGDNAYPWLTITALLSGGPGDHAAAPSWWPWAANFYVFAPVVASWIGLVIAYLRQRSRSLPLAG